MTLSEFMTLKQFAQTLGVSAPVVWRWRDAWGLPVIRLGRLTLIHEPSAAAWLKGREQRQPPEPERGDVKHEPIGA